MQKRTGTGELRLNALESTMQQVEMEIIQYPKNQAPATLYEVAEKLLKQWEQTTKPGGK